MKTNKYIFTKEHRRKIAESQKIWAAKNLLGHECYRKKTGWCVRVRAEDYPNFTDCSGNKHLKGYNNDFKYIRRSYKNWLDARNTMPKKNEVLFHLDGDDENDSVENLKVVSRSVLSTMAKKKRYTKNKYINISNIIITRLEQKIRRKSKNGSKTNR